MGLRSGWGQAQAQARRKGLEGAWVVGRGSRACHTSAQYTCHAGTHVTNTRMPIHMSQIHACQYTCHEPVEGFDLEAMTINTHQHRLVLPLPPQP